MKFPVKKVTAGVVVLFPLILIGWIITTILGIDRSFERMF